MAEEALANNWRGLRRDVAPHLLDASESPDTTDAAMSGDQAGILGPRRGRRLVTALNTNCLGVGGLNVPWGRYRVTAADGAGTDNATWSGAEAEWPATVGGTTGWDRITVVSLLATATGSATTTTNGTAQAFTSVNLANYGAIACNVSNGTGYLSRTTDVTGGYGKVQLYINSVWTDWLTFRYADSGKQVDFVQAAITLSGTLTQIRCVAEINATTGSGSGTVGIVFWGDIYLLRGSENANYTAA